MPKVVVVELTEDKIKEMKYCASPNCMHNNPEPELLTLDNFSLDSRTADGLSYYCKDCTRERNKQRRLTHKKQVDKDLPLTMRRKKKERSVATKAWIAERKEKLTNITVKRCSCVTCRHRDWSDPRHPGVPPELDIQNFHLDKSTPDGYSRWCTDCRSDQSWISRQIRLLSLKADDIKQIQNIYPQFLNKDIVVTGETIQDKAITDALDNYEVKRYELAKCIKIFVTAMQNRNLISPSYLDMPLNHILARIDAYRDRQHCVRINWTFLVPYITSYVTTEADLTTIVADYSKVEEQE